MKIVTKFGDAVEAALAKANIQLVAGWRRFYTMYSVWFFVLIGAAPDLYDMVLASGLITGADAPPVLDKLIKLIALMGAASRLLKQAKLTAEAQKNEVPISDDLGEVK